MALHDGLTDNMPALFYDELYSNSPFSTTCEAQALPNLAGSIARHFHKRSFSLFVYPTEHKCFNLRLIPLYRDDVSRSCVCEKRATNVDESAIQKRYPDCVEHNFKYLHDIRVVYSPEDECRIYIKPSFFAYLKKLNQEPTVTLAPLEERKKYEKLVDRLFIQAMYTLKRMGAYNAYRNLISSALAMGHVNEIHYRLKNTSFKAPWSDVHIAYELFKESKYRIFIQDGTFDVMLNEALMKIFKKWVNSDDPIKHKSFCTCEPLGQLYRSFRNPDEEWERVDNLPKHLLPITKDSRYPIFNRDAEKHVFKMVHPKNQERACYLYMGIYIEARKKFDCLRDRARRYYPSKMPLEYVMRHTQTWFVFFE
ncbi:hypothetical protein L596_022594 [Steinernema carpocapsae]|uniref:Uncharacterized protein n=1 Tax=Steinernema carpocapsae TaxID=34508 RepID=A0A4U5MM40_STECR|nr:hypothetical protein L596_022594 [Steinernema carpocapsae]